MKRVIRVAAAGSLGLMIGSSTLAGLHHDEPDREQINPSCHPTWGYHQTCWRRFRRLPPCDVCQECEPGVTSQTCQDGRCQGNSVYQPSTRPLQPAQEEQIPTLPMDPELSRNYGRSNTPLPSQPMAVPQDLSGRYGSASSVPMHMMPTATPAPTAAPSSAPQSSAVGGRYQGGPVFSVVPETVPLTDPRMLPSVPRPVNASPAPSRSIPSPAGLPPVSGSAPRSSGLYIPSQSHVLPGGGRYGNVSAGATKVPVRTASQSTAARGTVPAESLTRQHRYPVRPYRVQSRPLAAPLLQRPVSP